MLSVWKSLEDFDGRASLKTWLIAITRKKIADYYRKSRSDRTDRTVGLGEREDSLLSEDAYESVNDRISVQGALSVLTASERELVFLIFNGQSTYSEIESITGIPTGTIKSRMVSIKSKLKAKLEEVTAWPIAK